jgi:hypothetical protein
MPAGSRKAGAGADRPRDALTITQVLLGGKDEFNDKATLSETQQDSATRSLSCITVTVHSLQDFDAVSDTHVGRQWSAARGFHPGLPLWRRGTACEQTVTTRIIPPQ